MLSFLLEGKLLLILFCYLINIFQLQHHNQYLQLLEQKNLTFNELYIGDDIKIMEEMLDRSAGKRTVPQIFINDVHVGGYDDLYAIDRSGELDKLLES